MRAGPTWWRTVAWSGSILIVPGLLLPVSMEAQAPGKVSRPAPPAAASDAFVDSLIGEMTLEEKLGQLAQYRGVWSDSAGGPRISDENLGFVRAGEVGSFLSVYGAEYLNEVQRIAVEETRLGIPLLFAQDVIHGFRTIFPVPLGESASWSPAAVERSARIAAVEAAANSVHWTFAPMVDIARDPRWGRIVEGAGEDPYLGSVMAAARVRGFQGDDLARDDSVLATAKHYVAYGAAEAGRDYNTVDISERTLWEVYLPPFQAAVEAGVGSVMGAFNEIAGVPMHAHDELIDGVLRGEWGFDGVFVSDFTAVMELLHHGVVADSAEAGALALRAGVDVDMMSDIYRDDLRAKVESGAVPLEEVDEAVRRVLEAKVDLGLFDDPYRYGDVERERERTLTTQHRAAAREIAGQSIVLLKNEGGVLPLSKEIGTLAVIGTLADDPRSALGSWAAAGRAEDAVSVLDGMRAAIGESRVRYAPGAPVTEPDSTGFSEAVRIASDADAVILVLGETQDMSAEAASRSSIDLPGVQRELAARVLAAGTPTVVVLMNGRPLAIPWLAGNAPAILETWFLGVETGHAVADVVFGDVNPGGKLPVTFPRALGQVPIHYAHKNTGRPPGPDKYTSKYIDVPVTPLYPFGHGLSYTTFVFRDLTLSRTAMTATDTLQVSVDISNTGDRRGDEVVQLYVRDEVASLTRPVRQLRGFRRIGLAPGETRTVTFELTADDLAFHGPDLTRIVEPGAFRVSVGPSSAEGLEAGFEVTGDGPVAVAADGAVR